MTLPTDPKERKDVPIYSGVIKYFPDALAAVAECSKKGNDQHNPGKPLHWDRSKSGDELDALQRHLIEAGTVDTDGIRHSAKVAWRALANLQKEIEGAQSFTANEVLRQMQDGIAAITKPHAEAMLEVDAKRAAADLANDGWHENTGVCPVDPHTRVDVVFNCGRGVTGHKADMWDWRLTFKDSTIRKIRKWRLAK